MYNLIFIINTQYNNTQGLFINLFNNKLFIKK